MIDLKGVVEINDQEIIFRDGNHEHGRFFAKGVQEGCLYKLHVDPIKHDALVHDNDKLCKLWHKQFGHLLYVALPIFKDMVQGLPKLKIEKN